MKTLETAKSKNGRKTRKVHFQIAAKPGSDVFVAGTFNQWNPKQHRLQGDSGTGLYTTEIALAPGRHEYKFVVNGLWHVDPAVTTQVRNPHGTQNSVIAV